MKILANQKTKAMFFKVLMTVLIFIAVSGGFFVFVPNRAALCIWISAMCMTLIDITILYRYIKQQEEMFENAAAKITEYIVGNKDVRIGCDEEGGIYKLFHKVNSLAAILNARAEKELKSKEFLKDTISDISHQLKTPLAALNIYNGILQDEASELPGIRELADLQEQELDRIETLVQNLLKITRLDAGTIVLTRNLENVSDMMERVRKHFLFRASQEGKTICLAGESDTMLLCDCSWLMEAIDNIVKNALDHTKSGDTVCVEWRSFSSMVQIIIKDNGNGIHPEDLYHIFKRFYRSRYGNDTQGIGLGLPLAKAIVEAHSGTIEVSSELNVGTTFTISCPTNL